MRNNELEIPETGNSSSGVDATDEIILVEASDRDIAGPEQGSESTRSYAVALTPVREPLLCYTTLTGRSK